MKPNELRIGNWVKLFNDEFNKIHVISKTAIQVEGGIIGGEVFKLEQVQPIPLTPEILEKCGFDVVHKTNNHYAINDPNGIKDSHKISVFPTINNQWHIAFSDTLNGYNDYTPTTKIQYLHQLQNLVFALTGEELNFKL
jgi:hypothetical protein